MRGCSGTAQAAMLPRARSSRTRKPGRLVTAAGRGRETTGVRRAETTGKEAGTARAAVRVAMMVSCVSAVVFGGAGFVLMEEGRTQPPRQSAGGRADFSDDGRNCFQRRDLRSRNSRGGGRGERSRPA